MSNRTPRPTTATCAAELFQFGGQPSPEFAAALAACAPSSTGYRASTEVVEAANNTIRDEHGNRRFIDEGEDLTGWSEDELRQGIADYQAIIDRCDDSTYGGVAEGDCCADSRDLLEAELERRPQSPRP
jgi:hypothetical protein